MNHAIILEANEVMYDILDVAKQFGWLDSFGDDLTTAECDACEASALEHLTSVGIIVLTTQPDGSLEPLNSIPLSYPDWIPQFI